MVKYAPHTQTSAIARAKNWVGKAKSKGWCQAWVVADIFGTGGVGDWDGDRAADAEDGWKKAVANGKVVKASQIKNLNSIPAGLAAYWSGGSGDNGHAAVTAGNGQIYSTDLPTTGRVGKVSISTPHTKWGLTFLGYVLVEGNGYTLTDKPSQQEDDMPAPKDLWTWDGIPIEEPVTTADNIKKNPTWTPASVLAVLLREQAKQTALLTELVKELKNPKA